MYYISLYFLNLDYFSQWKIRLNISNIQWIDSACKKSDLLYGYYRILVVTILLHNVIHRSFHIQVSYMVF